MSFIHILSDIGKGVLSVGSKIAPLLPLPGPVNAIIGAGLTVANQELTSNSAADKKVLASADLSSITPDHPNKAQIISNILEGFVMVFKGVAELYPPEPPSTPPVA